MLRGAVTPPFEAPDDEVSHHRLDIAKSTFLALLPNDMATSFFGTPPARVRPNPTPFISENKRQPQLDVSGCSCRSNASEERAYYRHSGVVVLWVIESIEKLCLESDHLVFGNPGILADPNIPLVQARANEDSTSGRPNGVRRWLTEATRIEKPDQSSLALGRTAVATGVGPCLCPCARILQIVSAIVKGLPLWNNVIVETHQPPTSLSSFPAFDKYGLPRPKGNS